MKKMQKRKCIMALLPIFMAAALGGASFAFSVPAQAAGESVSNGITGEGTQENPYALDSVADLQQFAQNVNGGKSYENEYVTLTSDIQFMDEEEIVADMSAIGTKDAPFKGTFDGKGYTIDNLYIKGYIGNEVAVDYVGLFGYTTGATIKNVTVHNPFIVGQSYVGGIVGCAYTGKIENCHVSGEIDIEGYYKVGGITGGDYAGIYGCSVVGDEDWEYSVVTAVYKQADLEGDNVGGIVGYNAEGGTVSGCTVKNVTVSGTRKIGGVAGTAFQNNNIGNCTVSNVTVSTNATEEYASANASSMGIGGIVGLTSSTYTGGTISGCAVESLTLTVENELTTYVSAGAITGGHRGTTAPIEPTATTYANNTTTAISGATTDYLNAYAEVDEVKYSSLAEAFANADGKTVTLLADTYLTETVKVEEGKSVTLDLSGYEITVSYNEATGRSLYAVDNYGTFVLEDGSADKSGTITARGVENFGEMTINGGTIVSCDKNGGAAVWNDKGGTLTVNAGAVLKTSYQGSGSDSNGPCALYNKSGEVTVDGATLESINLRVYTLISEDTLTVKNATVNGGHGAVGIYGGTAVIEKGTFNTQYSIGQSDHALYVSGGTVTVNGGSFSGACYGLCINGATAEVTVAEGVTFDGGYIDFDAVEVNGKYYNLDGAVAAVTETTESMLTLHRNTTLTEKLVVAAGKKLTLDLSGYTLTTYAVENNYDVVINGELIMTGNGNVKVSGANGFGITSTGKLTVENGKFTHETEYNYLFGVWGELIINGGEFNVAYSAVNVFSGKATLNGGAFTAAEQETFYLLCVGENASLQITGGSYNTNLVYDDNKENRYDVLGAYCTAGAEVALTTTALSVKAQTNTAGDAIRFVSTVDTLDYAEVGFEITFNGKTVTRTIKQVFNSFKANDVKFTAESAFGAEGYLFAFTVTGVPAEYKDTAFTVRAYRKTENGAVIYGAYNQLKITDGINA